MELLMKKQEKSKLIRKPNPVYYAPHSYKEEDTLIESSIQQRSVDWGKFKNPLVKTEAKKHDEFIKIDYLRFDNKS